MTAVDLSSFAGLSAMVLLTINILFGLLISIRYSPVRSWPHRRFPLFQVHNWTAYIALGLVFAHPILLLCSKTAGFHIIDILWPLSSPQQRLYNCVGACAFYTVSLVVVTSYFRISIGRKVWKALHYVAYGAAGLLFVHGLLIDPNLKNQPPDLLDGEKVLVALLAYELLLGERKWKHLIPYFAISLNFGLQALWANRSIQADNTYALRFTPLMLWNTIAFYSSAVLFLPFAGLAVILLPIFIRDRRLYVGLILMAATLAPMLVLPQRMASVYWYVPLAGLAIALAAVASRTPRWTIALFFVLWLPLNYMMLREKRREILSLADENRWYTTGLLDYARGVPPLQAVVFQGTPPHMLPWGVDGAIREAFGYTVHAVWYNNPQARQAMSELPMAIVGYYPVTHKVKGLLRTRDELQSYLRLTDEVPNFQLGEGWYNDEGDHRWIAPRAEVTLRRPADSKEFEIVAFARSAKVTVFEDAVSLGTQTWSNSSGKPAAFRWKLRGGGGGDKKITIATEPAAHRPGDPRTLGIDVRAIGYVAP